MAHLIRPMEKGDLGQVSEIDREAFPSQWPPPNYRQELQNRLAHYLVVIDGDRTTAPAAEKPVKKRSGLKARIRAWLKRDQSRGETKETEARQYIAGFAGIWLMVDEAHITNIAVAQECRRKGIGELLLIAAIDMAKELKANTMTLEVRVSNVPAQKLYSKYGFEKKGTRHGYYLDNKEDALIMSTGDISSAAFRERIEKLREALSKKLA